MMKYFGTSIQKLLPYRSSKTNYVDNDLPLKNKRLLDVDLFLTAFSFQHCVTLVLHVILNTKTNKVLTKVFNGMTKFVGKFGMTNQDLF